MYAGNLYPQIIRVNRLQSVIQNGLMDFPDASRVGDFKLFVAFGFFFMAADADADSGGYFSGRHTNHIVTKAFPFPGGNCDAGKRHEQTIGQHDLKKLWFVDIIWIVVRIIYIGAESWCRKRNFRMGIFLLNVVGVHAGGEGILPEIIEA